MYVAECVCVCRYQIFLCRKLEGVDIPWGVVFFPLWVMECFWIWLQLSSLDSMAKSEAANKSAAGQFHATPTTHNTRITPCTVVSSMHGLMVRCSACFLLRALPQRV